MTSFRQFLRQTPLATALTLGHRPKVGRSRRERGPDCSPNARPWHLRGASIATIAIFLALASCLQSPASEGMKTFDGKYDIRRIEVAVAYFVPRDRTPLPDWKERAGYFCRRIERFHAREFQGQSKLTTTLHQEPFRSDKSAADERRANRAAQARRACRGADRQDAAESARAPAGCAAAVIGGALPGWDVFSGERVDMTEKPPIIRGWVSEKKRW